MEPRKGDIIMDYEDDFEEFCIGNMLPVVPVEEDQVGYSSKISKLINEEFNALESITDSNKHEEEILNESEDINAPIIFDDSEEYFESNNGIDNDILPVVQELNSKGIGRAHV